MTSFLYLENNSIIWYNPEIIRRELLLFMRKKKKLLYILAITIISIPAIASANWSTGNTARTWEGYSSGLGENLAVIDGVGEYVYSPVYDAMQCSLGLEVHQKTRDFLIVEDSILGKPVISLDFIENDLIDDGNTCPTPKVGIYLPDSITTLHRYTFSRFTNSYIHLPSDITNIPDGLFYCQKKLKQIQIPAKVKIIGKQAFYGCSQLASVKIPSEVKEIKSGTFTNCKNLTKLYIPNNVKKIATNAFKGCNNLTIYCEKNSYAYKYAKKNKIKTKLLSNKTVKATKITSLPESITVGTYEPYLLFPFIEPFYATNQTFAYISEDPSIIEVNQNGKINGKKQGTTTITVMTTDGSHLQARVKVTVKKGETTLNPYFSLQQLQKGTTKFNVDAMLYNRNANATYQIESSDSSIATAKVEKGILKVTAKKQGNAIFVLTEKQGKKQTLIGSFPISVNIK